MKAVSVRELKNNPSAALREAREHPVMVLTRPRPEAPLVHLDDESLLFNLALAGSAGLDLELDRNVERRGVRDLSLPALLLRVFRRVEVVVSESQLEPSARQIFYGRNLSEEVPKSLGLEVFE